MLEIVGLISIWRYLLNERTIVKKHLSYENGCPFQNFKLVLYVDSHCGICGGMFVGKAYENTIVNISVIPNSILSLIPKLCNLFLFFLPLYVC
jgi:hypothetical protein